MTDNPKQPPSPTVLTAWMAENLLHLCGATPMRENATAEQCQRWQDTERTLRAIASGEVVCVARSTVPVSECTNHVFTLEHRGNSMHVLTYDECPLGCTSEAQHEAHMAPYNKPFSSLRSTDSAGALELAMLRRLVEQTIMVAETDEDADGFISAYHFQTGAINRLLAAVRTGNYPAHIQQLCIDDPYTFTKLPSYSPATPEEVEAITEQGKKVAEQVMAGQRRKHAYPPPPAGDAALLREAGEARMLQAHPTLSAFYEKHALGSKARPSCLGCGRADWAEKTIAHMELPDIFLCERCTRSIRGEPMSTLCECGKTEWPGCTFPHCDSGVRQAERRQGNEPSVPQGPKVEPRKCTWGDPMGGCQGHPDDCHCVLAAEPEALTAAYERGWNAGYKSGKPVPQGMVLVPVEAPDEMLAAGAKTLSLYRDDMVSDATITDNIYRAMLSAAPPPDAPDLGSSRSVASSGVDPECPTAVAEPRDSAVYAELDKAIAKFPTWPTDALHALGVLGEEFGELTKEVLQLTYEPHKTSMAEVRKEAVQTAAMALRFVRSLDRYTFTRGEQHAQGDPEWLAKHLATELPYLPPAAVPLTTEGEQKP